MSENGIETHPPEGTAGGWLELVFETAREQAEALSDALFDAGALSVSVEDADLDTPDEQPLYGEPGTEPEVSAWQRSRVIALIDADCDPAVVALTAAAELGWADPPRFELRQVAEQDWVRITQAQFEPIHIHDRLWIVPSWHDVPAQASAQQAISIRLDPGLAFGTGSHATTRLCLQWLVEHVQTGDTVLDYGCGSGILAIAAALLGAADVWGVDIDFQAVSAARENARTNGVTAHFMLPDDWRKTAGVLPRPDIVVANILSNPLKLLAPMLAASVRPGGALVLSGVLERQAEDVAAAYRSQGMSMAVWKAEDGWVCLAGRHPA